MEPINERCYPSNFFDPFRYELTRATCYECREVFDIDDMQHIASGGQDFYFCQDCLEVLEILSEED